MTDRKGMDVAPLEDLFDRAVESSQNGRITIGSLLDSFGNRSFGPLLALFALIAILPPMGAVPGVPTTVAGLVILLSVQILCGSRHPWVPQRLQAMGFAKAKVEAARDRSRSWLAWIDKLIGRRMEWAAGAFAQRLAAVASICVALMIPPLEILPLAAMVPASAVLLFGLGLTARDGALMLLGFAASGGAVFLVLNNIARLWSVFG